MFTCPAGSHTFTDPVFGIIERELARQRDQIELIASENIVSPAVLAAQGSVLTNKYAEGYPGRRYYGGCAEVDAIEELAIERAKSLFNCRFANVQPHSGAQANGAVFLALLNPGDTILAMSLEHGGHLTHGSPVNISGKWFKAAHYSLSQSGQLIEIAQVRLLAEVHRPKLIVAGGSSYPRAFDFEAFRSIADEVGAILMVDMAHYAGLVAAGVYPSPIPHAHIVTTTTHKTLRGPRGGMILTNDEHLHMRINSAVFPGLQGGPLMHVIAAKAVAFGEAMEPSFKQYARQVVDNARVLARQLITDGFDVVTGGTDCHIVLVDLRSKNISGKAAETALERAGLTCNKNAVPYDPRKPTVTSGIRLGTPAGTTRGFKEGEFQQIGAMIGRVLSCLSDVHESADPSIASAVRDEVRQLCQKFPVYPFHNA